MNEEVRPKNNPEVIDQLTSVLKGSRPPEAVLAMDWVALIPVLIWLLQKGYEILRDRIEESGDPEPPL